MDVAYWIWNADQDFIAPAFYKSYLTAHETHEANLELLRLYGETGLHWTGWDSWYSFASKKGEI